MKVGARARGFCERTSVALVIKLVRHGESESNIGAVRSQDVGDHEVALSPRGVSQAQEAGRAIGREFVESALVYTSPYRRTRSTLAGILAGAGIAATDVRVYEDPRLREVEPGYEEWEAQQELRRTHGWFYYRFRGGESPADCFDRTSMFLESMMRQVQRKAVDRVLVVSHGLTIRCFVMRFLHLTIEQFDELANPHNCDVITLAEHTTLPDCRWLSGKWGVSGLGSRSDSA